MQKAREYEMKLALDFNVDFFHCARSSVFAFGCTAPLSHPHSCSHHYVMNTDFYRNDNAKIII